MANVNDGPHRFVRAHHPSRTLASVGTGLALAGSLAACGSGSGSGTSGQPATPVTPASTAANTDCSVYMSYLTPQQRLTVVAKMAVSKGIGSDAKTILAWEVTAATQCQIDNGTVGQYVGPSSGLIPATTAAGPM